MSKSHRNQLLTLATSMAGLAAAAWMPQVAYAAQAPATVGQAVEEVLVTARRREESLQDVPIAISAFGAAALESRGVERVENMNSVAPNLLVMGGGNAGETTANFRVRGMPGVSIYVDGVDQPQTDGLLTTGVVEIDRIEVLRGPQGTLFGNASLGGAISYITKLPADTFGARLKLGVGSLSRRDIQAAVDIPFGDSFKTKFTVSSQFRDGFLQSKLSGARYGDINDQLVRADFLWKPIDKLNVRYNVEKSNTDRDGPARVIGEVKDTAILKGPGTTIQPGAAPGGFNNPSGTFNAYQQGQIYKNIGIDYSNIGHTSGFPGGNVGEWETMVNATGTGLWIDQIRHTLDMNYEINDTFRVRSISGYKDLARYTQGELDGSSLVTVNDRDTAAKQFTFGQELQLLGTHEKVDWVLGAFYQKQYIRTRSNQRILAEMTCDLWSPGDKARRGITTTQQADCFNLRAKALGVTSVVATPFSNFNTTTFLRPGATVPTTTPSLLTQQLNLAVNTASPSNNGVTPTQFSNAVATTSDQMTITKPESQAIFGDLTWRLTDKFSAAVGLRYSKDKSAGNISLGTGANAAKLMSYNGLQVSSSLDNRFGFIGPLPTPTNPTEFSATTKRLTLQYKWTPDLMTYIGYSDGYGPGGTSLINNVIPNAININAAGVAVANADGSLPYFTEVYNRKNGDMDVPLVTERKEQSVKNYEMGLRADWLGGALRTNVTVFYTDWRNVPTSTFGATLWWDTDGNGMGDAKVDINNDQIFDPVVFPNLFTVAATKAEAKGIELETNWRASDNLRMNLNVGYLKTKYKELGDAALGIIPALAPNSPFAGAPEYTASLGAQYEFALANGAGFVPRIDYTYTDDYTLSASAAIQRIQKGFGLLNARLTYDSGSNWSINVTGSNLTNEWYFNSGLYDYPGGINFVTVGRPREYGLTFDFRFD